MNRLLSFRGASIKRKQVLIIMLNTTAALLLAFAGFTAYEVVTFRAAMVRSLTTLAQITGNNVAGTLDFNDPKSAAEDLFALRDDPHIIGACVYGGDGAPFAAYGPGFNPPARVPDAGHVFSNGNLSFTCPIKSRGDVVGALYVVSDCEALYARLGEYAQIAGAVFVLTLVVALVLSSRLQRLMCQPILQLARAARLAGQNKDYGVRVVARNPDEIGALVESFNDMLAQIQERDTHLEQRVAERTRELEREVAGRKQTEVKLDYERDLLRSLMEHSSDSIYFKDCESRFICCSKAMCDRFGTTSEGIIGKTDFDLFDTSHAREAFEDEQRILQTGLPIHGKVEHEIATDGTDTWALTSKMPLRDKTGNITGTFGISKDITAMKAAEASLEKVHRQLLEASRQAGMAEVATSVLHNVGNVLNSVTVSTTLVLDALAASKVKNLGRLASLLAEHKDHLPDFFASDRKAREILPYLQCLADTSAREQENLIAEMRLTRKNIEHIKDIVAMQQNYASYAGVVEKVNPVELVEDALRMNDAALARHQVRVIRRFDPHLSEITADKHKILQILVNLVRNAKYACDECDRPDKTITVELNNGGQCVRFAVADNGVGIPAENLHRIFNHGFTTRKTGHGFGLHSGALAAREMGGSLTARSDGPGAGACFTLDLPLHPPSKS